MQRRAALRLFLICQWIVITPSIVGLSLLPDPGLPEGLPDKGLHAVAGAILGMSFLGLAAAFTRPTLGVFVAVGLSAITLGAVIEVIQGPLAARDGEPPDAIAGAIGTFLGLSTVHVFAGRSGTAPSPDPT